MTRRLTAMGISPELLLNGLLIKRRELTIGIIYKVLSIESGNYRIIDDSGEDYLYFSCMFELVDLD